MLKEVSTETLEKAVRLLGNPDQTQEQAADVLIAQGTSDLDASRLVSFIPEAFGIVRVSHFEGEPGYPSAFLASDKKGQSHVVPFTSEPIFIQALRRAQAMYHEGPQDVFTAVSSRSSIFKLIDDATARGLNVDGATIAIAVGIAAENYRKSVPSFWQRIFGLK